MKGFVIGLVLGAVILAAVFFVPRYLPGKPDRQSIEALKAAELAKRELHAYDPELSAAAQHVPVSELEKADLDQLAERSGDALTALQAEMSKTVRQAQSLDRKYKMPAGKLRALPGGAAGLRSGIKAFSELLRENDKLLADAEKNARSAASKGRGVVGVNEASGMVNLARAERYAEVARHIRTEIEERLGRCFSVAMEWAACRADRDHYAGLDVSKTREQLEADLEEVTTLARQAGDRQKTLAGQIAEARTRLKTVREDIQKTRTARMTLAEAGFQAGNDASFDAYRRKYLELSKRLVTLQTQEMLLAYGGIEGGEFAGDDYLHAPIEGGHPVVGIDELGRRLERVKISAERYAKARTELEQEIQRITRFGQEAQKQREAFAGRLDELAAQVKQLTSEIDALAKQAVEVEDKALRAAREAATAARAAKSAVDRWKSEASSTQSKFDSQRQNERLTRIARDERLAAFAAASEAQAKMLAGRVLVGRALRVQAEVTTLGQAAALMPSLSVDLAARRQSYQAAVDAAVKSLTEARDTYQRLVQKGGATRWAYQASLALVSHLLWQVDTANAAKHRSDLIAQLGETVKGRTQWPHLQEEVELYSVLTGGKPPTPGPGAEPGDDTQKPAEESNPSATPGNG